MKAAEVEHYIQRAKDFLEGGRLMAEDASVYRHSAALLAIHSAISYSDALRTGLGDTELAADDHRKAALSLQKLLRARKFENQTGLTQFDYLVSQKTNIAYGNKRLADGVLDKIVASAQKFAIWANRTGTNLKLDGWQA